MPVYDSIGQSYSNSRLPDPRIVDFILKLLQLKPGSVIADIGAGTGGYSTSLANRGYQLYAVEPSAVMRSQSPPHSQVQWLNGCAEDIPLPTSSVDAVICILATHHFSNLEKAIREMQRITKQGAIVILTFDPRLVKNFWFTDYFSSLWEATFLVFPPLSQVLDLICANTQTTVEFSTLMLPHDLSDLFMAALWRRPELYLNPVVRAGISAFALADDPAVVELGVKKLNQDLSTGEWNAKYGSIKALAEFDAGYRFLYASDAKPAPNLN